MKKVVVLMLALMLAACGLLVDDSDATRAVTNMGFTNPVVIDKDVVAVEWAGCSEEDAAAYTIAATNPRGVRVSLLVCVGWPFKGATVRSK